jgi:hypothetical protein
MGRYLELADRALRCAEVITDSGAVTLPVYAKRVEGAGTACDHCGSEKWIASLVIADGACLCAACYLGWKR